MTGTAVTQPNYADFGQTGSAYPTAIDAITQAMARIAAAFNPHAVPAAAAAPVLTSSAGGALGARTYYSKITLVTPAGEVAPSAESSLVLVANTLLNVASPTFALGVTGWNVYVSTATGTETKQNSTPIAIGPAWVEPTGGLISGAALPAGLSLMAVIVDAGATLNGTTLTEVAVQVTSTITAPTTNPRIDRVVVDALTGTVSVVAGTEAASPVAPAIPAGKNPCAKVALSVGQTSIANANITDERTSNPGVNAILNTLVDAKGDLIVATADNTPARLAVGTNGAVLTADSTQATGVKWAPPAGVPAGALTMYGGSTAPTGWLLCDGSAVSRSTYADLFTAIGTAFGVGDGSTTFNVPDMRSRSPIGAGQGSGLTNRALAATGGAETHTLTTAEMPAHTHSYVVPRDGHEDTGGPNVSGPNNVSAATDSTGGNGAHNNMHPFLAVNFIIKT